MVRIKFIALMLVLSLAFSCSEKEEDFVNKSEVEKLIGTYMLVSADLKRPMIDAEDKIHTTKWGIIEDCVKDNLIILETNGKAQTDDGATSCFGSHNHWETTWQLNGSKTRLILDDGETYEIISFNEGEQSFMVEHADKWWVDPAGVTEDGIVQWVYRRQ